MKRLGCFEVVAVILVILVILLIAVVLTKTVWESDMPMWLKILLLR